MISRNSSLPAIKIFVKSNLNLLYDRDEELFNRNKGKGVSERCIVFRFAHYLQNNIENGFYVDCDFNSSYRQPSGKALADNEGNIVKRFVDIIIHKRSNFPNDQPNINNLICFEIKKWNNYDKKGILKDETNLTDLTSVNFGYAFGFYISLHRIKEKTKWSIYENGRLIEKSQVFG